MDGVMQCSFRRNITLPGVKNRFNLNTSYYIFLAAGAAVDGKYIDKKQSNVFLFLLPFSLFSGDYCNCSFLRYIFVGKDLPKATPILPDNLSLVDLALFSWKLDKSTLNCIVRQRACNKNDSGW